MNFLSNAPQTFPHLSPACKSIQISIVQTLTQALQSVLFDSTSSTLSLQFAETVDLDGNWFRDGENCDPITIEGLMVGLKNKDGIVEEDYVKSFFRDGAVQKKHRAGPLPSLSFIRF